MNIIKVDCLPLSIFVGYERENDARGVTFDYSAWVEQYGDGVLGRIVALSAIVSFVMVFAFPRLVLGCFAALTGKK